MKRLILSLIIGIMSVASSFAMGLIEARQQAYFLTDKMAYELDLTPMQYEQVFQVNMEYFLNVDHRNPYGYYWDYRNADLSYILFDWQYRRYRRATYFLRPIVWRSGAWYFPIVERYAHTYYFFNRPTAWDTWRGGIWKGRVQSTPSPFIGRRPDAHNGGMRHNLQPGSHHGGNPGGKPNNNGYYGGNNNRPNNGGNYYNGGSNNNRPNNGGSYNGGSNNNRPNNGGNYNGGSNNNRPNNGGNYNGGSSNNGSRGGASMTNSGSRGGASAGIGSRSTGTTSSSAAGSATNGGRSFGNNSRR